MSQKKAKKARRGPGPTGKFPDGKLDETNEGELEVHMAADLDQNVVLINFGKPIAWLGLPRGMALSMAESLREHADKLPVTHGVDCNKEPHTTLGYLHSEAEDDPYDVDGVSYCGRCHRALDSINPNPNAN